MIYPPLVQYRSMPTKTRFWCADFQNVKGKVEQHEAQVEAGRWEVGNNSGEEEEDEDQGWLPSEQQRPT